tara:strand:- start:219 stop:434 length:216 start_codon:yes stop_codon:yes gene_type:complete
MRDKIIQALISHAKGHIQKHIANVEVYMSNPAGVAEHPDVIESIEKELAIIADYEDQLEVLEKYFEGNNVH